MSSELGAVTIGSTLRRTAIQEEGAGGGAQQQPRCGAALLTTLFPKVVSVFPPGYVFLFFCGMMVMQLVWVKFMVPETKGISLEQMQQKLGIDTEPDPQAAPLAQTL